MEGDREAGAGVKEQGEWHWSRDKQLKPEEMCTHVYQVPSLIAPHYCKTLDHILLVIGSFPLPMHAAWKEENCLTEYSEKGTLQKEVSWKGERRGVGSS